jgi:hypothetical protein
LASETTQKELNNAFALEVIQNDSRYASASETIQKEPNDAFAIEIT